MSVIQPHSQICPFLLLFVYQPELNRFQKYKQKKKNAMMENKDVLNVAHMNHINKNNTCIVEQPSFNHL